MVELYNDYDLMNSINGGQLWKDLADLIKWQKDNADVLMDAHWVGGDPWTGSKAEIYGWAAWNGEKATLALRNGANSQQSIKITLREAFEIPANINGSIVLTKCFADQANLQGLTEGQAINIDTELTLTLPASSVYMFGGRDSEAAVVAVESITFDKAQYEVEEKSSVAIVATVNPTNATVKALEWTSSDEAVATVANGLVKGISVGEATIIATATDGSGVMCQAKVTVTEKVIPPYSINFDKDLQKDAPNNRALTEITFTPANKEAQTIAIPEADRKYRYRDYSANEDMTLSCQAGEEINVGLKHGGSWMHGYVYIDLDQDQQFSFKEGETDQSGTDLVSFFFYSGDFNNDASGVNSLGETLTGANRNAGSPIICPKFNAPTEAGTYRIRFKTDWNSVDAGGEKGADGNCTGTNAILTNGGTIIDATLVVEANGETGIGQVKGENGNVKTDLYDLSGRKANASQHGVFIQNGKKVVR